MKLSIPPAQIRRLKSVALLLSALFVLTPPPVRAAAENPATTIPSDSNYKARPTANKACEARVAAMKGRPCDIIFIGDSITQHFIEKPSRTWTSVGAPVWEKYYANRNALDFGVGSDTTQNVLWRMDHMDIKNFKPKGAVVLIGTNNYKYPADEIAAGVKAVVQKTRRTFPDAKIILVSILPNARASAKMAEANQLIQPLADDKTVFYLDLASKMQPVGDTWKGLGKDRLHLTPEGYELWAATMEPLLGKLISSSQ